MAFLLSPFITKAEFDSLKNNFQSQIDQYNSSIDSKIDGAIAAYLAGIKVQTTMEETSLLNKCSTIYFIDTFDAKECKAGTYAQYMWNVMYMTGSISVANSISQLQVVTGAINAPSWKTVTGDKGFYYYGTLDNNGYWEITNGLTAYPISSMVGATTSGGGNMCATNASFALPNTTYKNNGAEFETVSQSFPCTMGRSVNIDCSKSFNMVNSFENFNNLMVWGGSVPTKTFWIVKASELNKCVTETKYVMTTKSPDAYGYELRSSTGTTYANWRSADGPTTLKMYLYLHYYYDNTTDTKATWQNIKQPNVTTAAGVTTTFFNGLPLFKASQNGTVKMKLKFANAGNATTNFRIQNAQFNETAIPTTAALHSTDIEYSDSLMSANAGEEITITIKDVKKDDLWWIKAIPLDATTSTYITTTSIKNTKEE